MVEPGTMWTGVVTDQYGPFAVALYRRKTESVTPDYPEWVLLGGSGVSCGQVQCWAVGDRMDRPGYYNDYEKNPRPLPPRDFEVRLKELQEIAPAPDYVRHTPVRTPTVLRFRGVVFCRVGCSSDSIFCTGKAEFSCGSWEAVHEEEPCDEPLLVRAVL